MEALLIEADEPAGVRAPAWRRRERDPRALLLAAKAGSANAREEIVRRYWQGAHRQAYFTVGDPAAAEDIAQESLLAALRALDGFDPERAFAPWLHTIVLRRSIDWLRAQARRKEVELGEVSEPIARPAGVDARLLDALCELGDEDRAIVVMRHLLGYTPSEIAEMLAIGASTVRSRLQRALGKLRSELSEDE